MKIIFFIINVIILEFEVVCVYLFRFIFKFDVDFFDVFCYLILVIVVGDLIVVVKVIFFLYFILIDGGVKVIEIEFVEID